MVRKTFRENKKSFNTGSRSFSLIVSRVLLSLRPHPIYLRYSVQGSQGSCAIVIFDLQNPFNRKLLIYIWEKMYVFGNVLLFLNFVALNLDSFSIDDIPTSIISKSFHDCGFSKYPRKGGE